MKDPASAEPLEQHLPVRRTARYYTLGGGGEVREVWVVCHGFGQLAGAFVRPFASIASRTRLIVAPEALNRYYIDARPVVHGPDSRVGATWMTREDREHEIDDYVAYLDALTTHVVERLRVAVPPAIVGLGFSQGAATVARWGMRTARPLHHLILWGAMLPHDMKPTPRVFQGSRLSFVHGTSDESLGENARVRLRDRLGEAGLAAEFIEYEGGHHLHTGSLVRLAERG